MHIAIIGAGMAGLAAAQALTRAGVAVRLFDKGRGPGGRMSTRRTETRAGVATFDHGAQYFTARSAGFAAAVAEWRAAGVVAAWAPRCATDLRGPAFVGVPAMSSVVRHLAAPLDVSWGREVVAINTRATGHHLTFAESELDAAFDRVVVAVPPEQAARLLASVAPDLAARARAAVSLPCWAAMVAFDRPLETGWDVAEATDNPAAWIARNASKPERAGPDAWVVHASPEWTLAHLEDAPEDVASALAKMFRDRTKAPEPAFVTAHRWRFARIATPLGTACQFDPRRGIGTCGDWHLGARVEFAWRSGAALAEEILR